MADQTPKSVTAPLSANEIDLENALDAALEKTFPASDPTAVGRIERRAPSGRDVDRPPAAIDKALVERLAELVKAGRE